MKTIIPLIISALIILGCINMESRINELEQRIIDLEQLDKQKDIEELKWRQQLIYDKGK